MCVQLQRLDHALGLAPRELRDAATREIVHELHSEPRVAGRDSSNACHVMVLSRGRRAARTKGRPSWPLVPGPQPIVVSTTACALTLYDGSRVTYVTGRVGLGQRGTKTWRRSVVVSLTTASVRAARSAFASRATACGRTAVTSGAPASSSLLTMPERRRDVM